MNCKECHASWLNKERAHYFDGVTNQALAFVKFHERQPGMPNALAIPFHVDVVPWRVWTLYHFQDESKPPRLPYAPVHNNNAFMEDYIHDWNVDHLHNFRYASRVTDKPVWILMEFKVKEPEGCKACVHRAKSGLSGLCPACARDRAKAELDAERAVVGRPCPDSPSGQHLFEPDEEYGQKKHIEPPINCVNCGDEP